MKNSLIFILLSILLLACSSKKGDLLPNGEIYRPPTQVPTQRPPSAANLELGSDSNTEESRLTSTPSCTNGLWFLADLTIPDGTVVQPGEVLDKRWEVQNSGTCNWDERYKVALLAGPAMGVPVKQALVPALSGTKTMIRMIFIAPDEPDYYRSAWQAYDPEGNAFGVPFFIDIVVEAKGDDLVPTLEEGED